MTSQAFQWTFRMIPTCAACLQPLTGRGNFVIVGTEVVHKECARRGRETVLYQTKASLAWERAQHERSAREFTEATKRQDEFRAAAQMSNRRALADAVAERDSAQRERDRLQREFTTAQAELEALRRAPSSAPSQEISTTPDSHGERDPTEVRFSLLEFDPI